MRASGRISSQLLAPVLDRLDLVVQEVDLAAALQLAQHGLADHAGAFVAHEGLDGQAALRRGGDHAQVAQAFERHAQRARDRRGGQREHVDLGAHRLHRLLVAHAEAMLLVDDQQAQVLELDVDAESSLCVPTTMSTRAVGQALGGGRDLPWPSESAIISATLHRPLAEAVDQRLVVLLGQQRGRRQERHLLAAGDGDEGRAQRHLGLAEADVAADQPVHRLRRDHVLDHGMDRGLLVGRLVEAEVVGEHLVVGGREAERVAFARRAPRVDVEQLGGRIAHLLGGLAARLAAPTSSFHRTASPSSPARKPKCSMSSASQGGPVRPSSSAWRPLRARRDPGDRRPLGPAAAAERRRRSSGTARRGWSARLVRQLRPRRGRHHRRRPPRHRVRRLRGLQAARGHGLGAGP